MNCTLNETTTLIDLLTAAAVGPLTPTQRRQAEVLAGRFSKRLDEDDGQPATPAATPEGTLDVDAIYQRRREQIAAAQARRGPWPPSAA